MRIASNFDARLRGVVAGLPELAGLGDSLVISSEVGYRKPHPAFYRAACESLGLPPGRVLCVGDDPENDVLGPDRARASRAVLLDRSGARPTGGRRRPRPAARLRADGQGRRGRVAAIRRRSGESDPAGPIRQTVERLGLPGRATWITIGRATGADRPGSDRRRADRDGSTDDRLRSTRPDPRSCRFPSVPFREERKSHVVATVEQLAALVRGRLVGDGSVPIHSARPVGEAGPGDITFIENERYAKMLRTSPASAAIVGPHFKRGDGRARAAR